MSQTTTSTGSLEYNHPAAVYIRQLEQENAKLRAQQSNTRLGLEKLDKLITKDYWLYPVTNNEGDLVSLGLMDPTGWEEHLSGKTLADLIDQVNQLEEKDNVR